MPAMVDGVTFKHSIKNLCEMSSVY